MNKILMVLFFFAVFCNPLCVGNNETTPETTTTQKGAADVTTTLSAANVTTTIRPAVTSPSTTTTLYDLNKIRLSEMQAEACIAAGDSGNCEKLYDLGLVSPEDCCVNLGRCC